MTEKQHIEGYKLMRSNCTLSRSEINRIVNSMEHVKISYRICSAINAVETLIAIHSEQQDSFIKTEGRK